MRMENSTISKMFDYFPGNHGLTEEVIYNYSPLYPTEKIPIFSGSENNIIPIGYIRQNAKNNKGEAIVYFVGPCLILTKDGSAGLITYKSDKDGTFTINHHACALKLKEDWKGRIDLQWFAHQFRRRLYRYVTSKSDNGVFSTKWFDRIVFEIPDYSIQMRQLAKKEKLHKMLIVIDEYLDKLKKIMGSKIDKNGLKGKEEEIGKIFTFKGGNSGLTEEFIYYNQPTSDDDKIPILSGATLKANLMGYISRNAKPDGKNLKIFKGPAILVVRKGIAGQMTYINDGEFTTNDDAYVLISKKEWKDKINLRWFVYQYQELFFNLVTSKSDNATFNKKYAQKQKVKIPDITAQNTIADKLIIVDKLIEKLKRLKKEAEELMEYEII